MRIIGIVCIIFWGTITSCSQDKEIDQYNNLVKKELALHKQVDSLFLGIYFGMSQKNFFAHCWEMNQKKIFSDGSDGRGNMYVLYKLNDELKYPATMNFYPDFTDSTISGMRVNIQYSGWAPWNKKMYTDSLLPDVLNMVNKWYRNSNPFIRLTDKKKGTIYIKVDGNRRITIGKYDDMIVKIDYTDMLVEQKNKSKK